VSYQDDQEVSRLFFLRRPPAPGGAESEWRIDPVNIPEISLRLDAFLATLPGPQADPEVLWSDSFPRILEQWLDVPCVCIRAFHACSLTIRDKVLEQVPESECKDYRDDLPALVVHWIRTDAGRAWEDPLIRELLTMTATDSGQKMSIRFTLLLSFVPDLVFAALWLRPGFEATRDRLANERRRWANPRTRLDPDDPWVRDLRRWAPNGTDKELKQLALEAHIPLQLETERAIFAELGLDKSVGIADTKQRRFWNAIALPLIDYLQPHMRARNTSAGKKPVTPDAVFRFTSQLLALRSNGRWEDKPGRLKSRHYRTEP
jgi:hypothetical protein